MNQHLQSILNFIEQDKSLSAGEKNVISKFLKDADKELEITAFKLERTEKVKHTTAILLEETIEELEQKRKAIEAQNRELEIESSLERVRTVAMSMNKHDDLLRICEILYAELQTLGFNELRNVMINIYDDDKRSFLNYDYSANAGKTVTLMPYNFHPLIEKQVSITRNASDAFYEFSFMDKELKDFRELRKNNGEQDDPKLEDTSSLHYYFYSIGSGSVGISTYNAITDEKKNVLKRFRNVFDLAYRRYIDIAKAEAQAKEVEIQLALERVRARSLAMHQTSELQDVVNIVAQQLHSINIDMNGGVFITINDEVDNNEGIPLWASAGAADYVKKIVVPFLNKPIIIRLKEAIKKRNNFLIEEYSREEKISFFEHLFNHAPWNTAPPERKQELLSREGGYTRSVAISNYTSIAIINHNGKKFSDDDNEILKRFGKVFEQAYTRFLDLQKAEAQARESQIQLALERVRARTMAMQKSEELPETSKVLFKQMKLLGEPAEQLSIGVVREEHNVIEISATLHGEVLQKIYSASLDEPYLMDKIFKAWKAQQKQ